MHVRVVEEFRGLKVYVPFAGAGSDFDAHSTKDNSTSGDYKRKEVGVETHPTERRVKKMKLGD